MSAELPKVTWDEVEHAATRIFNVWDGSNELAWDENPETPLDYLAEDLEIDAVALGYLAHSCAASELDDVTDDYAFRDTALRTATDSLRTEIFNCLRTAYGDEMKLYSRMWHTRSEPEPDDDEVPPSPSQEEFDPTGANSSALEFGMHGFKT